MLKLILITLIIFIGLFLICFPFWHVGGTYYRGFLLIYDIRPASGGFIPAPDFVKEITWIRWADPTSFEYVHGGQYYSYAKDRFNVYCDKFRLNDFDPNTFHPIQAPITNEWFYIDKTSVRFYKIPLLKAVSGDRLGDSRDIITEGFDVNSFQPLGTSIFKDKNGVYTYFLMTSISDNSNPPNGYTIDFFKKQEILDAETFKIDSCDEKNCKATDKNGIYTLNRTDGRSLVNIKKIE
jgi:hypothetical protein